LAKPKQNLIDGKWVPKFVRDADAQSPAGGVSSSVNDLAKWMRLQLNDIAGAKISVNDFVIRAAALALRHHPS